MRKILLSTLLTTLLSTVLVGAEKKAEQQALLQPILIADFEGHDYGQWKTTGSAFGDGPTDGTASSTRGGDNTTGSLTSPEFTIQCGYINFRIRGGNFPDDIRVQLIVNGKAARSTSGNHHEKLFWFSWDVLDLKGRSARIVITDNHESSDWGHITIDDVEQSDARRGMNELYRPQFHITAQWKHLNDVNGLVYYDGEYHVFHQASPWYPLRNKCWGHLVSKDLIHWKRLPHALTPIGGWGAKGSPAYSGSAVVDHNNTSGFQTGKEKPIVLIWTAIGTGQFIAYSNDRGRTFTWYDKNPIIPQERDDRDPMVRWHEPTKRWVMALPEQKLGKMGFHVSDDLKKWTRVSTMQGFGDCPDYYKLPVDGDTTNEKWIVYGGHGVYRFGDFDGTTFHLDEKGESHRLWLGHQYATQTFNNTPDGRKIMMVWVVSNRGEEPAGMPYTQMLSFPTEMKIKTLPEGVRVVATPIKEIELLHKTKHSWSNETIQPGENLLNGLSGMLFDIRAEFEIDTASEFGFRIRGDHTVSYDVEKNTAQLSGDITKSNAWKIPPMKKRVKMQILVDRSLIEAFYDEGRAYLSTSFFPDEANQSLELFSSGGKTRLVSMDVYELKSAWDRAEPTADLKVIQGKSPIDQPYPYVSTGRFCGPEVPESPDPLISYRWPNPKATDGLEIYLLKAKSVSADRTGSFDNLQSLTGNNPNVTVTGTGSIRLDFGLENAAWVEFDSPDCPGGVEMSISEYNEPGHNKTRKPVKHGNTYRLELNDELYEGVRFAWINVKSLSSQWHITGIRAVCQVKPTNYNGSFSCSDPMLTKIWYMSAYGVKASLCKDYFGAILMNRGDRMSWTGDAHPTQAAALVAFGNYDFIKQNIDNTSEQSNGIRSYSLYWVLSLLDYYNYTGDTETLDRYISNACSKLDEAYKVFRTNPNLRYYGWDERLCAGFELWFKPCPEAQNAYKMLSIRTWKDFAAAMGKYGRTDLRDKYNGYASAKMADLRKNSAWFSNFGLHAAADAVTTGLLKSTEQNALFEKHFIDRVNRISFSPFNQYFIIQAMARMKKYDDALSSIRDLWGGMIKYGGTTTFEVFRPSWNYVIGPNDALPNNQCGLISLCHPWGAGPVKWLNEEVLGIVSTSPGFTTYDVLPHLGRTLTRVSGKTPTPLGDIRASFDVSSGICKVSAPAGTIGRIGIPKVEKTITSISINGNLAWDGTYHSVSGVGAANQDSDFIYFTSVRPGDYTMSVSYSGTTPAYNESQEQYAARFVKQDTTTSGNWGGVYGKEGYVLCNFNGEGRDKKSLPSYVTSLEYFRAFPRTKNCLPDNTVWVTGTSDKRALSPDSKNSTPRNATCYSNNDNTLTVTIGIDGTRDYQVALYFVDWDKKSMRQVVEMFDANTLNMIAPVKMVNGYSDGKYLVYSYNKSVKFRIDKIRGNIATLSGIFFDPKESPADAGHH